MITYETLKSFCANEYLRPALNYAVKRNEYWWASNGYHIICVPMKETQQGDIRFLLDELPKDLKYPNVEAVMNMNEFTPKYMINVSDIKDAINKIPKVDEYIEVEHDLEYIKCPQCNGSGNLCIDDTVYYKGRAYDVYAEAECPICHGNGKIPNLSDYDPNEDDFNPEAEKYIAYEKTGRKIPDEEAELDIKGAGYIGMRNMNLLLQAAKEQGIETIEYAETYERTPAIFSLHGVLVGIVSKIHTKNYKGTLIKVKHIREIKNGR